MLNSLLKRKQLTFCEILYLHRYGTSQASGVLVASTSGEPPSRPASNQLMEMNDTCIILRLYSWPEKGCPILAWKVWISVVCCTEAENPISTTLFFSFRNLFRMNLII